MNLHAEVASQAPADFALAVDIGGTKAALAFIDANGRQLGPVEKYPVSFASDGAADSAVLVRLIAEHASRAQAYPGHFAGIGLSLCGNVDLASGEAVLVPNLHWHNLPFGSMLAEACRAPVTAATDVRMALLAEVLWGKARAVRYAAWATVGTGYGGYLYLDGQFYGGTHGFAGNFGHTTWDEVHGRPCGCGRSGCVETFVAGPGITAAGLRAAQSGDSPLLAGVLASGHALTTADVFQAEASGDAASHAIIEDVIRLIAINLGGVVNTLDLDMIIMGGGVVHTNPNFVPRIAARIHDFLMTVEAQRDLEVVEESFENSALMGAAADVFYRQTHPGR
jgi:glucokinase